MNYFDATTIVYYDGAFIQATDAHTTLYNQTLHYGYGVFEGIRSYQTDSGTQIFKSEEHYERLLNSCRLMGIPFEYSIAQMTDISYQVLEKNGFSDAYIRPLIACDPCMTLINGQPSRLLVAAWEWGAYLGHHLLRLKISPYCRPHPRSMHIEAKASGHYVNSILATSDARKHGFNEALLLDCEGFLAEGPGANLFFEKDGVLYTPALGHILPGITRNTVKEIAAEMNITLVEDRLPVEALMEADRAFFCGTGAEVAGIDSVDDYKFPLDWEASLGYKISQRYQDLVRGKN